LKRVTRDNKVLPASKEVKALQVTMEFLDYPELMDNRPKRAKKVNQNDIKYMYMYV